MGEERERELLTIVENGLPTHSDITIIHLVAIIQRFVCWGILTCTLGLGGTETFFSESVF